MRRKSFTTALVVLGLAVVSLGSLTGCDELLFQGVVSGNMSGFVEYTTSDSDYYYPVGIEAPGSITSGDYYTDDPYWAGTPYSYDSYYD